jgi:hypothetical protein
VNPLDILYAWQSALLAIVIVGLTQAVKAGIEAYLALKHAGTTKTGRELRGEVAGIDRAVLPLVPLLSGAILGAFVPMRPEVLVHYVNEHGGGSRLAYAMWGAAIGQFSDYLYQRFKKMLPAQTPVEVRPSVEVETGSIPPTPEPPRAEETEPSTPSAADAPPR